MGGRSGAVRTECSCPRSRCTGSARPRPARAHCPHAPPACAGTAACGCPTPATPRSHFTAWYIYKQQRLLTGHAVPACMQGNSIQVLLLSAHRWPQDQALPVSMRKQPARAAGRARARLDGCVVAAGEDAVGGRGQRANGAAVALQRGQARQALHIPHAHLAAHTPVSPVGYSTPCSASPTHTRSGYRARSTVSTGPALHMDAATLCSKEGQESKRAPSCRRSR